MMEDLKILYEVFPFSHFDLNGEPVFLVKPIQIELEVVKLDELCEQMVIEKLKTVSGIK